MAAEDGPRETILRNMRYERLAPTLMYRTLRKGVIRYLTSPHRDRRILAECRVVLEAERDAALHPQKRENFNHELRALETFERSLNQLALAGLTLVPARHAAALVIEGVRISVQPTAYTRLVRPRGGYLAGALVIDLAKGAELKTDAARLKAEDGRVHAASLLHRHVAALQYEDDTKAATEQCVIFHAYRQQPTCAPKSAGRMYRNIEAVCKNIARGWENIIPPPKFEANRSINRTWN